MVYKAPSRITRWHFLHLSPILFSSRLSSNDSICSSQHVGWNRQADLLCRLQIDDELELHRLLDRQVSRLGTLKDLVHVNGRAAIQVESVRAVGHENTGLRNFPCLVERWESASCCQVRDPFSIIKKKRRRLSGNRLC